VVLFVLYEKQVACQENIKKQARQENGATRL
jgi:hypothetical protein